MKRRLYLKNQFLLLLFAMGSFITIFITDISAWTSPTTSPPYSDPGFPTDSAGDVDTGCDCKKASLKKPGSSQGDWPQDSTSQDTLWKWWKNGETSWSKSGNATNTYNCHSYIFNGSSNWLDSPSNYKGSTKGCWKVDSSGTVRSSSSHSCTTGYSGKCGRMFLQNKNDDIYGTISTIYKKVN